MALFGYYSSVISPEDLLSRNQTALSSRSGGENLIE